MIYTALWDDIQYLVHALEYISIDQIESIFEDRKDCRKCEYYIQQMVNQSFIDVVDKERGILKDRKAKALSPDAINQRVRAINVMTATKSESLIDMYTQHYPTQIGFITSNNLAYDVTIVNDIKVAQMAAARWKSEVVKSAEVLTSDASSASLVPVEDTRMHIALVKDQEMGNKLEPYGFKCYCILDGLDEPHFYVWE